MPGTTTTSSLPIPTSPRCTSRRTDRRTARRPGRQAETREELRIALSAHGRPVAEDPAYRGRNRIDCLGLSVGHAGTMTLAPHRLRRFVGRIATRIDAAASPISPLPATERARYLVSTDVMLDDTNPFAVPGLSALLDTTTDRGIFKTWISGLHEKSCRSPPGGQACAASGSCRLRCFEAKWASSRLCTCATCGDCSHAVSSSKRGRGSRLGAVLRRATEAVAFGSSLFLLFPRALPCVPGGGCSRGRLRQWRVIGVRGSSQKLLAPTSGPAGSPEVSSHQWFNM